MQAVGKSSSWRRVTWLEEKEKRCGGNQHIAHYSELEPGKVSVQRRASMQKADRKPRRWNGSNAHHDEDGNDAAQNHVQEWNRMQHDEVRDQIAIHGIGGSHGFACDANSVATARKMRNSSLRLRPASAFASAFCRL